MPPRQESRDPYERVDSADAAVANAIFNATGVRIRDYPRTLDKVLAGWE
ncbi:hypothetical protein [Ramlibacter humi]|nr:hypothetical protein [Ramlibacter humi]